MQETKKGGIQDSEHPGSLSVKDRQSCHKKNIPMAQGHRDTEVAFTLYSPPAPWEAAYWS